MVISGGSRIKIRVVVAGLGWSEQDGGSGVAGPNPT